MVHDDETVDSTSIQEAPTTEAQNTETPSDDMAEAPKVDESADDNDE